jgi:hypothetical protein
LFTNKLYINVAKHYAGQKEPAMAAGKISPVKKAAVLPAVGLFSTPGGVRTVQSPVRMKILAMLAPGELPFDEIV